MGKSGSSFSRRSVVTGAGAFGAAAVLPAGSALAKAALAGPAVPQFHRYKIGAFEVTALNDGGRVADDPHKIFGIDKTPEEFSKAAEANFLPADKMRNSFTPVIINTGKEVVLFDTGNGARGRPDAGQLT